MHPDKGILAVQTRSHISSQVGEHCYRLVGHWRQGFPSQGICTVEQWLGTALSPDAIASATRAVAARCTIGAFSEPAGPRHRIRALLLAVPLAVTNLSKQSTFAMGTIRDCGERVLSTTSHLEFLGGFAQLKAAIGLTRLEACAKRITNESSLAGIPFPTCRSADTRAKELLETDIATSQYHRSFAIWREKAPGSASIDSSWRSISVGPCCRTSKCTTSMGTAETIE